MTPNVVEYDKRKMTKPAFDLILGCQTMKELGIVLDFRTKEITIDHIILPMREINSLTPSNMDRAWAVNNSMAHEPQSTQEATRRVVNILDAKYEKADLQSIVSTNCTHLSLQDQNSLLELLTEFEELLTEHWVIGKQSPCPLNSRKAQSHIMERHIQYHNLVKKQP